MDKLRLLATTTFGLEACAKREITALGFTDISVQDGRVDFSGGFEAIPKANLWLRTADRVMLIVGEFEATTFDELFEGTKALPWGDWITEDGKFTVTGKSVKSKLFSVSDCQAIVKKAVVERLKQKYSREWFPETGPEYKIQVGLLRDKATLSIDTTGPGLHKRGYRPAVSEAPIKETLAAALVDLSYFRRGRVLYDPFCGSGTIPIEAAMASKNIAPGLKRRFVSESWPQLDEKTWRETRQEARDAVSSDKIELFGTDIDPDIIETARHNAKRAGVADCISFEAKNIFDITALPSEYGVAIMNPPYGERLATMDEAAALYKRVGEIFRQNPNWSVCLLTSDEDFEKYYGKRADSKRKLFNGMIKTDYYQYHGKRPE